MFLLGRQAMFGHDPPMYLRSITATRCPWPAKVHAAIVDPVPPPRITRSYSSKAGAWLVWVEESASFRFICVSPVCRVDVVAHGRSASTHPHNTSRRPFPTLGHYSTRLTQYLR